MQRPDQIDLFIPFIFLHMPWNPISGDAAFTPKDGIKRPWTIDDFEPNAIAHFFELWRDFDGRRLPVSFDRDWLDVVAVHNGRGVSLAVTNMGGRQLNLDLSQLAKKIGTTTAQQTRLNYHKGEVVFQPKHEVPTSAIPIDVNETTVIRFTSTSPLKPKGTLALNRWYAHETAKPAAEKPQPFTINIDQPKNIQHARLIIGAHRRGGLTEALAVKINGHPIAIDLGDAGEFSEFFAPLETTISKVHLRKNNQIEITSQPGTTITSVQILAHSDLSHDALDLFANNDLSQWWTDKKDREGKWSVKDGVASRGDLKAGGLTLKAKPFNFELSFEWNIAEGGNSGIKYRGGLEYQLLDDERHIRGKTPNSSVAALYDLVAPSTDKPSKPAGQWNTGRIIAKGNHIQHWLNGAKVLEIEQKTDEWKALLQKSKYKEKPDFGTKASGIHLQDHGANVHFRKVFLQEFPTPNLK